MILSKALAKSSMRISVCWPSCKFLEMSSTNSMSCVSQEWPFRNPCSGYRILFSSPCFMILLANICSIVLQQTDVKDIGL